ncbi:MAG: two-component system, NtrC family, sensor kinase [Cyanobacteria bacterium RYN_339]|nr:two-component system, NtrC family, sensor kinase [Cyanobacteria bacterium RYN_339]
MSSSDSQTTRRRPDTGQLVASERLHTMGQLVAGVIHELNNPLTIVGTNLQVLVEYVQQQQELIDRYENQGPEAAKAYAEEIDLPYLRTDLPRILSSCQEGALRARQLVDELRRYSIANSPEVTPVDVKGNLSSTVRLVESSYRNKVTFELHTEQCPPVMGVNGQIQQVLMNLLINACQAMNDRPTMGHISIRTRGDGTNVYIEIADNGPGIPADVLPRIFEPYFSTKSPADGTGLGLPISKRICEKHGGSLVVASTVGQGTTFTITLPVEGSPELLADPSLPYEV